MSGADRPSVHDLSSAKAWLWTYSNPEEWLFSGGELPREVLLVADTYWLKPSDLVEQMRKEWNEALGPSRDYRGARYGRHQLQRLA